MFRSPHFIKLILNYCLQCKFAAVEQLYAVVRTHEQHDVALASFRELFLACASALWRAHDGNGRKMNFVVIGAGLTGSVIARILAENGFRCRVIEKENHVAGNCHTDRDHHFGPHTKLH